MRCLTCAATPPPLPLQSHATRQLPGSKAELLGVAPAAFVLLQGNPQRARPAGALLLQVQTAPGPLGSSQHGGELLSEGLEPMLRVLVSAPAWAGRGQGGWRQQLGCWPPPQERLAKPSPVRLHTSPSTPELEATVGTAF